MNKNEFDVFLVQAKKTGLDYDLFPNCIIVNNTDKNCDIAKKYYETIENYFHGGLEHFAEVKIPNPGDEFESTIVDKISEYADILSGSNRFHGVFVISFFDYEKSEDLLGTAHYRRLLNFVRERRKEIKFLFLVHPRFGIDELKRDLENIINLEIIVDINNNFIEEEMRKEGIYLDEVNISIINESVNYDSVKLDLIKEKIRYLQVKNNNNISTDDLIHIMEGINGKKTIKIGF